MRSEMNVYVLFYEKEETELLFDFREYKVMSDFIEWRIQDKDGLLRRQVRLKWRLK